MNSLVKAQSILQRKLSHENVSELIQIEIITNLAIVQAKLGEGSKAKELIQECMMNYSDSKYRNLIILANSQINILNKDIKTAIEILKNVEEEDSCYETARIQLANIYLNKLE